MQSKEVLNLADTVIGEINRMCITADLAELDVMAMHAKKNIDRIWGIRYREFMENFNMPEGERKDG